MVETVLGLLIVRVDMRVVMKAILMGMSVQVIIVSVVWQVRQRGICYELVVSLNAVVGVFEVSLDNVEAHLEYIVIFKGVLKALFLVLSVDVTEFLCSFRMLDSHL